MNLVVLIKASDSKKAARAAKIERVMREFKNGTLKTSAGKKVTSKSQALAIAQSEADSYVGVE